MVALANSVQERAHAIRSFTDFYPAVNAQDLHPEGGMEVLGEAQKSLVVFVFDFVYNQGFGGQHHTGDRGGVG